MPVVTMKPDTLDEENVKFAQVPLTQPVFLNSVPKCGSHLLRNIMRMFVPVAQQYQAQFVQFGNLQQHLAAFDTGRPKLSWGHLFFSDASAIETAGVRRILLVRDPYDWVLARTRFFLSDEFSGNVDHIKEGSLSVPDLLNLMIFGIYQKAPALAEIFTHNAVAWLGTGAYLIRYEDLVAHLAALDSADAELYFKALFNACGMGDLPMDWRDRVRIGSDRNQSATARENLTGLDIDLPKVLPKMQQRLVDVAAPGLRQILGYA
jgi:hypothetical protein